MCALHATGPGPAGLPPAFRPLERGGVLHAVREAVARGFGQDGRPWANMGQGAPETGPLPGAPERLTGFHFSTEEHEYAPLVGVDSLREAVAALYNARYRRGRRSQYTAANVMISPGGRTALTRWAATLGSGAAGYLPPDYTAYEGLFESVGAATPVALDDPRFAQAGSSAAALDDAIRQANLASVLLSNPNNPSGRVRDDAELEAWLGLARRHQCCLVLDEFYAHYVYEREQALSAAAHVEDVNRDPVLILDGLTKNWRYPGLRVSWLLAPQPVIELMTNCSAFLDGGCMRPVQTAVLPLLEPAVADREAAALRSHFAAKRVAMQAALTELGVRVEPQPEGSFYLWGDVSGLPSGWDTALGFLDRALDQQVLAIPGQAFDLNPQGSHASGLGRWDQHLRFSYGPELPGLLDGLARLRRAF